MFLFKKRISIPGQHEAWLWRRWQSQTN